MPRSSANHIFFFPLVKTATWWQAGIALCHQLGDLLSKVFFWFGGSCRPAGLELQIRLSCLPSAGIKLFWNLKSSRWAKYAHIAYTKNYHATGSWWHTKHSEAEAGGSEFGPATLRNSLRKPPNYWEKPLKFAWIGSWEQNLCPWIAVSALDRWGISLVMT